MSAVLCWPPEQCAYVVRQRLSDGSFVHNVNAHFDGALVTFGCKSEDHAFNLVAAINSSCWIEVREREIA